MVSILTTVTDYLVSQSWQLLVVFVLVAAACWGLRKASAHWRYLLWLVVLAKCLTPAPISVPLAVLPPPVVAASQSEKQVAVGVHKPAWELAGGHNCRRA